MILLLTLDRTASFDTSVVMFGTLGCGKSSIINLLAGEPIAQVSADVQPCTKRSRWYQVSIGEKRFRLWDTPGFRLAYVGDSSHLLPYEQAHALLRNIADGVNLILLCARKDEISASLGSLYRLINDFLCDGRIRIALVITHLDTPDEQWWERNKCTISQRTNIPVQSIPHVCVTAGQTDCDQSKQALKELLQTHAAGITLNSSRATPSVNLTTHCGLSPPEATALSEEFNKPRRPFNVVFFGETGAGMSSVINLLVGYPVAEVSLGMKTCTLESRSYRINTGMLQFRVWDTMGLSEAYAGQDMCGRALENAARLIRDLSGEGGIDLLVFCKRSGKLTAFDVCAIRLFEAFFCEGQVPVAVVVTHLEWQNRMEKWWEVNGDGLVKAIGRNVIGHACITSLASDHASAIGLGSKLLESRLSIQDMLEDCVSSRSILAKVEANSAKSTPNQPGVMGNAPRKITVTNLIDRCGLTKRQAEELIKLRYGA